MSTVALGLEFLCRLDGVDGIPLYAVLVKERKLHSPEILELIADDPRCIRGTRAAPDIDALSFPLSLIKRRASCHPLFRYFLNPLNRCDGLTGEEIIGEPRLGESREVILILNSWTDEPPGKHPVEWVV